ncbi:hypothetical protein BJV74DRAFT_795789 [Russula compacta]|nr:hypothetical protein BJV74DRAFT_795789 [Russula compacta]
MSDQSGSSRLQALFDSALQDYEKQTGISLPRHPLAEQLQNCDSVDSVIAVLQQQAQTFSEFRGSHRIMKSLNGVVSVLSSFPPAKAIHTGLAILLATIKGVGASYDALAELLESIEHFLKRLDIYTKIPPTSALTEVVVKIMGNYSLPSR